MRLAIAALALLLAAPAFAQAPAQPPYSPPRLGDGRPDLQGVWENRWLTPLEKTGPMSALTVTPEQAAAIVGVARRMAKTIGDLANDPEAGDPDAHALTVVRGEHRTRMIVTPPEGTLPYTPEGLKALQDHQRWFSQRVMAAKGDGPEDRLTWERCLAGMGQAPLLYGWGISGLRRVVQTKDMLVIHSEAGGETRVIRIGGKPLPAGMTSFIGDSVGRWEGDTLVVETTGFRSDDQFRMSVIGRSIMVGTKSKVVERFTRAGEKELNYQFTVEDKAIYAKPWLAEYSMAATSAPMFEFACHEGNYGLANILSGQRQIEQRAAAKAAP
ncbi:MAG: hypothetical protein Q8R02_22915 [Hyphomonadaceae bacterium]|nr:hypothetical protein [Hyphomonadaceae bacterium]